MTDTTRVVTIAHQPFTLSASQIERSMRGVLPEPVRDHFVVVNQRRYPPKQELVETTGLDRAEVTTHHARRVLTGLGFPAGRRSHERTARTASGHAPSVSGPSDWHAAPSWSRSRPEFSRSRPSASALDPFLGQWVATKGAEVLVAAPEPHTVIRWLAQHNQQADSMFRVPRNESEAGGLTPL